MIDTYLQNNDILERANFFNDFLRDLGWIILNLIKTVVNLCEDILNSTIKILDLTIYDTLEKIIPKSQLNMLLTLIFACCILYIGYIFIFVGKKENTIFVNMIIAIMILTGMPLFLNTLNNFTKSSIEYINPSKVNTANEIIKSNTTDLLFMDNNNFTSRGNNINVNNIDLISPTEVINPDERAEVKNKDIFLNEVVIDVNGFSYIKPIKTNILGFIDTTGYYYRYNIQFIPILISFIATCIAFGCTSFKVVKIVFEIVISQILATLYAPSDIYSGQKMKKIMTYLLSCYLVLIFAVMSLKIYIIFQEWITVNMQNGLLSAIIILFLSVALIDGANIIERIVGIDAGLSSSFKTFASWYGLSKIGTKTTSKFLNAATNMGAFSVGAINGAIDTYKSYRNNNDDNNNNGSLINKEHNSNDNTNPLSSINNKDNKNSINNDKINFAPNNNGDDNNNNIKLNNELNENKDAFEFLSNNKLENETPYNINEQNMGLENQNKEFSSNNSQDNDTPLNNRENRNSITSENKNQEISSNKLEEKTLFNNDNNTMDIFNGKESLNNSLKDFDISSNPKELKDNFNNFNIKDKSFSDFQSKNEDITKDLSNLNNLNGQKEMNNLKEPNIQKQTKSEQNKIDYKENSIKQKYNSGKEFGKDFSKKMMKKRSNNNEGKNNE